MAPLFDYVLTFRFGAVHALDPRFLVIRCTWLVRVTLRTPIAVRRLQPIQLPEAINLFTELAIGFVISHRPPSNGTPLLLRRTFGEQVSG